MANLNVNVAKNYANLLGSATKILMMLLEYYDQQTNRMEDYPNGIDEDLQRSIEKGPYHADLVQAIGNDGATEDVTVQVNKKKRK